MPKVIIGNVNVFHPGTFELVTLEVGDPFPDWAEGIITNPAVVAEFPEAPPLPVQPEPPAPKRGGSKSDKAPVDPRADLAARAKALGIEFTDETTDPELELLIASKE